MMSGTKATWLLACAALLAQMASGEVVGVLPARLVGGMAACRQETNLGDFAADAIYHGTLASGGCDMVLLPAGALGDGLAAGPVTTERLRENFDGRCPALASVETDGSDVLRRLEEGTSADASGGLLQVAGLHYTVMTNVPAGTAGRVRNVTVFNRTTGRWDPLVTNGFYRAVLPVAEGEAFDLAESVRAYCAAFAGEGENRQLVGTNSPLAALSGYAMSYGRPSGAQRLVRTATNALDYAQYRWGAQPRGVMTFLYDGPDSRGFSWQTDTNVTVGAAVLLEGDYTSADAADFAASGVVCTAVCQTEAAASFTNSLPALHHFLAHASALRPGATYSYRVGSEKGWSYGRFTVRPVRSGQDMVTVLNLPDFQVSDAARYPLAFDTCLAAASLAGGAEGLDFVLTCGDFIDGYITNAGTNTVPKDPFRNTRLLNQWSMAADTATGALPEVPWVHAAGNHDYRLFKTNLLAAAEHMCVTSAPFVGCHSFDCGSVHFVTLPWVSDTDWQKGNWETNRHPQIVRWLKEDLEKNRARGKCRWTVVSTHAGPYTTGDNMREDKKLGQKRESQFCRDVIREIATLCSSNGVDLVLQGHDHTYSKTLPYRWFGRGYATDEQDGADVNLSTDVVAAGGIACSADPEGTYYVSAGCSGHRLGELTDFAARDGGHSYTNRTLKVVTGRVAVQSPYGNVGDDASRDTGMPMFGVLRATESRLVYDFYVVDTHSHDAVLFDSLGIVKAKTAEEDNYTSLRLDGHSDEIARRLSDASSYAGFRAWANDAGLHGGRMLLPGDLVGRKLIVTAAAYGLAEVPAEADARIVGCELVANEPSVVLRLTVGVEASFAKGRGANEALLTAALGLKGTDDLNGVFSSERCDVTVESVDGECGRIVFRVTARHAEATPPVRFFYRGVVY